MSESEKAGEALRVERILTLGKMCLGVTHDINNQLTVIAMHADNLAELLRERGGEAGGALEDVQRITDSMKRITSLLSHMPRFTKPEERVVRPLDLNTFADEISRYLVKSHPSKKLRIEKSLARGLRHAKADKVDAFRAAVECAAGAEGVVRLRTENDGDGERVRLVIETDSPAESADLAAVRAALDGIEAEVSVAASGGMRTYAIVFQALSDAESTLYAA